MFYPLNPELATVCDLATWPSPVPSRSQTVPTDRWSSIDRSPAQGTRRLAQVLHKFQEDLLRHVSVLIAALEVSAGGCPAQMSGRNHVSVCVCVCAFFCLCPRRMDLCLVSMSGLTNLVGSKILYTQMELTYSGSTSLQVFDNWNKDQIIRSNTTKFGWARYILDASCLS